MTAAEEIKKRLKHLIDEGFHLQVGSFVINNWDAIDKALTPKLEWPVFTEEGLTLLGFLTVPFPDWEGDTLVMAVQSQFSLINQVRFYKKRIGSRRQRSDPIEAVVLYVKPLEVPLLYEMDPRYFKTVAEKYAR